MELKRPFMILLIFISIVGLSNFIYSQTLSGFIIDDSTQKPAENITVGLEELKLVQTAGTNGYFIFKDIAPGFYHVKVSGGLYGENIYPVRIKKDLLVQFYVKKISYPIEPEIKYDSSEKRFGSQGFTRNEINAFPGGLSDSMRFLQNLSGISGGFALNTVPIIRGSNPQFDRVYIDDYPVDYPYHYLAGILPIFSALNAETIESVSVTKGLSSMNDQDNLGNTIHIKTRESGHTGFKSSLRLEPLFPTVYASINPIPELSVVASARRSLVDWMINVKTMDINFQDYFFKGVYQLFDNHRLTLTAFGSSDHLSFETYNTLTSFDVIGLKWEYLIQNNIFLKTIISRYDTRHQFQNMDPISNMVGVYFEFNPLQYRVSQTLNVVFERHTFHAGYEFLDHENGVSGKIILPDYPEINLLHQYGLKTSAAFPITGKTLALFTEYEYDFDPFWLISGLKYTYYAPLKNASLNYRLMLGYYWNRKDNCIYGGFGSYQAFPDMYYYLGTDVSKLKPAVSMNWLGGIKMSLPDQLLGQAEVFHYTFENLPDQPLSRLVFDNSIKIFFPINPFIKEEKGYSYGWEIMLKKIYKEYEGWASLTLITSRRDAPTYGLANYPSDFSQDLIFKLALKAEYGNWNPSLVWYHYTSLPYTPITGNTGFFGINVPQYGIYNSQRYPDHNRLDIKISYQMNENIRFYAEMLNLFLNQNYLTEMVSTDATSVLKINDIPFAWAGVEICF